MSTSASGSPLWGPPSVGAPSRARARCRPRALTLQTASVIDRAERRQPGRPRQRQRPGWRPGRTRRRTRGPTHPTSRRPTHGRLRMTVACRHERHPTVASDLIRGLFRGAEIWVPRWAYGPSEASPETLRKRASDRARRAPPERHGDGRLHHGDQQRASQEVAEGSARGGGGQPQLGQPEHQNENGDARPGPATAYATSWSRSGRSSSPRPTPPAGQQRLPPVPPGRAGHAAHRSRSGQRSPGSCRAAGRAAPPAASERGPEASSAGRAGRSRALRTRVRRSW